MKYYTALYLEHFPDVYIPKEATPINFAPHVTISVFDNEKELDPLAYIDLPINKYSGTNEWLDTGKKISIDYLESKDDGKYLIILEKFFSIIEIQNGEVSYLLNKVNKLC